MRAPQLVSDFFEWRWAPCVGLTAGSLSFVALALLVIPTRFGAAPAVNTALSSYDSPRPQRAIFSSSLARSLTDREAAPSDVARVARPVPESSPAGNDPGVAPRRGFSPIIDRPEPPPAPPPAPPAAPPVEPPAAVPGAAVVIQPEPAAPARDVP